MFSDCKFTLSFLNDYIDIGCLKGLKSEQIEDMSERFVSMWDNERDSDIVKKIHLTEDTNLFVIAMIEHQSTVDYTTVMKILRYMVMIWTDYEKEMDAKYAGISKTKDFKYPPILPIVYYEDDGTWTATTQLSDRIALADYFREYVPDYRYEVVRLHDYTNEEIVSKKNELSLFMLINKLKNASEFKELKNISPEYLKDLQENAPQHLLELLTIAISAFMHRLNIPKDEIADFTDSLVERRFSMLFDSFNAYDVQAVRREARCEAKAESLLLVLAKKGELSEHLKELVSSQTDAAVMDEWFHLALDSASVQEFEERIR
ncbi:MAG: Rpn family recombination-promoting nuclease/putative transposase [Lachnospiraceae bacterium]